MSKWIAKIAGVQPGESRRTLVATLFYFFFVAHVVMVKSASNALFLSRHNPRHLPYLYITVALLVAIVVVFASKSLADPRQRRLRLVSLASVAVVLVLCWLVLLWDLFPISPFVYLFGEVAATALNIQFWSVAGDIFDPQEGKRVFGILAGGGMTGSIFGGLVVHGGGMAIGTIHLLPTAALALGLCLLCAHALTKHHGRADDLDDPASPSLRRGFGYVVRNSYPRTFAALMLLGMVLTSFVDYFFRTSAQAAFPSEDQLAVLFGDLNFYIGVLSVSFLFLASNRFLRRFGIFPYLLIVPAGMVAASVAAIFFPVFLAVYALKIIESSGSLSINQAGLQLLYNPVPTALRAPTRGVVDGLARKFGYAVGGGLLLLLVPVIGLQARPWIVLGMVALYVLLLLRLRVLYVRALDEKLRVGARRPVRLRLEDAQTRRALLRVLDSGNEELVLTALRLLAGESKADLRTPLKRLIVHASERIRIAAIEAIARRGYKEFLFDLLGIINDGSRRSRVAAIRAVVELDPDRAVGALSPYLRAEDPGLVAASIEAMIQLRGYRSGNAAVPILESMLDAASDDSPARRREVAKLLGRLGEGRYAGHLVTYLADPEPSVRRLAAASCKRVYRESFVPRLLKLLSDRETRQEARAALAAYGDRVVGVLESWLNDRERPLRVRLRLPRILRMIGTQRAGEALLFSNPQDDAALRYRIALAVSGIRLQHQDIVFDRKRAMEAVERRVESYRYYAGLYGTLAGHLPNRSLVLKLLRERLQQNVETAFRVLGLVYGHRTLMSIHHRFSSAVRESVSDAIELLDNVVGRESRERLLPILERHKDLIRTRPRKPEDVSLEAIRAEMEELSGSRDLLLRSAAIHTRCSLGDDCAHLFPEIYPGEATMDVMEKVLFLESVDIFRQNNLDDLAALAAIARERAFESGESILTEGEPGDALYIITEGEVHIVRGQRRLLTLGARGSLGGVSLLDQKPHAASAVCATDCRTLVIDRIEFMDLVSDRVELLHGIFLALTDRLRALLAVTDGGGLADSDQYTDGPTNPV
ncbi:MAG: HEAT repeat domain-containing protein [Deltaproteobacteria bacterium]|nr:HEAT repeat domain-containing protein [Deltaproteobacteria bacterium]